MQLRSHGDRAAAVAILRGAVELGIDHIDATLAALDAASAPHCE
jgi:isopropylmalate/homocitrate/citramalate synthase